MMANGGFERSRDDDSRRRRTGTVWTASATIITCLIGSGVLSVAWSMARLGWFAGLVALFSFSSLTYFTSTFLASIYPSGHPVTGNRNYNYMDVVRTNLGGFEVKLCGAAQYLNIFGVAVGYTISAATAIRAMGRSHCIYSEGGRSLCNVSSIPYMIAFGVLQTFFSQIQDFDKISRLSVVPAIMSFTYSSIGLVLGIKKIAENRKIKGSLTGVSFGVKTETQKIWRSFQALGDVAFAYSYSIILVEIQDTLKSPPSKHETMEKANLISVAVTTIFFIFSGCIYYAAFGDTSPRNLVTAFGYYNPYWLLDIINAAILIHHIGAYQLYCQSLYAFVERTARKWCPDNDIIAMEFLVPIPGMARYRINPFRLITRSIIVIITTLVSILMLPFFDDVVGILKAVGFWILTVYLPVKMHINQEKIPKWSRRWILLYVIVGACLIISIAAAVGSLVALVSNVKDYKPFKIG